jgi:spore germination protein
MAKTIELPGGFIERLESVFLTIWIMTIFSSISIGLFVVSNGMEKLYAIKMRKNIMLLVPILVLIALYPENVAEVQTMGVAVEHVGVFYAGTVPAGLFLLAKLRNLGAEKKSPTPAHSVSDPLPAEEKQC